MVRIGVVLHVQEPGSPILGPMVSLQPHLAHLLDSLPPSPVNQDQLRDIVNRILQKTANTSSPENRKAAWEYLLKSEIFHLAETEGTASQNDETKYYQDLCGRLDLVLVFTELGENQLRPSLQIFIKCVSSRGL